jgi:hypothetical protein
MSKALKTVGTILGGAALLATGVGAIAGIGLLTTVGTIAGVAAGVANLASQTLASNKPPPMRGSVSQIIIEPNAPQPYVMGEGYFAGVLRHRTGYGGTVAGVENPYLWDVVVYSGGGPVQSISPRVDYATVPAWYSGYLATDTQLGATPEATALAASYGTPTGWGASHKLSGQAAIGWNYKFDKTGQKFASGLPLAGAYGQWVKAYDPRLDSTFPGGSGSHLLNDEDTWEWTENPALHAGTYAFGRYQNGRRTIGIGLPEDGIDWEAVAAWANVCEANDWTLFGVLFEPGDRWQNLKDICAAGGGEPVPGGVLTFRYDAPAVSLDTITEADIADEAMRATAMQSYRDRVNTVLPQYRSPAHNWEMVQAPAVTVSGYVTEDGEERPVEWPFNFVKVPNQAAQLAAYKLVNAREIHPIELVCEPRMRAYRPGDCLHLELPQLGLDTDAIVLSRSIDPATMKVGLTLIGETAAKHAYALGLTTTAPATPSLGQDAQERDETAANSSDRTVTIEVVPLKSFAADYAGTVQSGLLPGYIVPEVMIGGTDYRTDDAAQFSLTTNGVTVDPIINTSGDPNRGIIAITGVTALEGWIDLAVTVGGVAQPTKRIVIQKNTGLPPDLGGAGSKIAGDNTFPTINSTSYAAITDVLTVTLAGGESLYGTAPLDYYVSSTSPTARLVTATWQYSVAGAGVWTDFDTAITGSTAVGGYSPEGGSGFFSQVKSGLAGGNYDVRLMAKLNSAGTIVTLIGTATIEAKV